MENTNNTPETIQKYIDMEIVSYIDNLTNTKSFAEINGMIKLLDQEQILLTQNRGILAKNFATVKTNSKEFDEIFTQYVGSFVLEQKLIDRRDIAVHIKGIKGASNVLSPKAPTTSSKEPIEAKEKAPVQSSKNPPEGKLGKAPTQSSKSIPNGLTGSNLSGGINPKGITTIASQPVNSKELAEQVAESMNNDHRVTGYLTR